MPLPTFSVIWETYLVLALLAVLYNRYVVEEMERRGLDGWTWLQVAGGVGFTLVGLAVVSWPAALMALGAFAASGLPMIVGALVRRERRWDWQLAAAFRKAELLAGDAVMERIERQLYAEQIRTFIAEARRLLADVTALREP